MSAALELNGIVKNYGRRRALDGLDLLVPRGSVFGLVGSNGAGKTTALAAAAGVLHWRRGTVDLLGEGPFNPWRHAGRVSLLPQDSRLPLYARAEDLLFHYGRLQGLPAAECRTHIDEVLAWVHLEDRRRSPVRTLSHGMQRRLMIAQAFLGDPELILLDEPINGLDPREAARMRAMLQRRRGNQTVVISSHNLHDLESLCDHAAFIEAGKRLRQDCMSNLTRRTHRITYYLEPAELPIAALEEALPKATWEADAESGRLSGIFSEGDGHPGPVNAVVLPLLLKSGVRVIEVHCGSKLEGEYLRATDPR